MIKNKGLKKAVEDISKKGVMILLFEMRDMIQNKWDRERQIILNFPENIESFTYESSSLKTIDTYYQALINRISEVLREEEARILKERS
jgi:hypothetical protein